MKSVLLLIFTLLAGLLSACSMPGMQYEYGGSQVWRGQADAQGNAISNEPKIYTVSPALVAYMAREKYKFTQARTRRSIAADNSIGWEYRVGPGDILSVIVWDHPELTNPAGTTLSVESSGRVVRPDGSMFYPHVGSIQVAGKTVEEIRIMLTQGLAPNIEEPQVDVRVIEFRSQFVNVVGDVDQPCRLPVTDRALTVIEAMNQCQTIRPAIGNRALVLERGGQKRSVDLHSLYRGQDVLLHQPLQGGDTLYVQDDRWNRIFVVGEVNRQASINIPVSGLSLAEAMNAEQVEGINQMTANVSEIYVFRGGFKQLQAADGEIDTSSYQPQIFHLNLDSADALLLADQFHLQPRDIVYASSASLVSYSRAASLIIPTISTLLQAGILIDRL